jgi:uncharacterized SAM-binding protein YcdF (DUF218 family)
MFLRILKYSLFVLGCIFLVQLILCFTSLPFWTYYRLGTKYAGIHRPPECIVVLGGGGIPSETGLMRTYYAAEVANYFKDARVIIALPGDTTVPASSVTLMKKEMMLRGVETSRISFEAEGTNTRAEALNILALLHTDNDTIHRLQNDPASRSILLVSSPEHLCRAVLTFRKAGFTRVDGLPAFESAIESDLSFNDKKLGGRRWMPGIGQNITLRYRFWTQLRYEELILREWCAIAYYKLKGWI